MTPEEMRLSETISVARSKLAQLGADNRFPDLRDSLDQLRKAIEQLGSPEQGKEEAAVTAAAQSITTLYRTSMSQANATPQKYQQPVFQCTRTMKSACRNRLLSRGRRCARPCSFLAWPTISFPYQSRYESQSCE